MFAVPARNPGVGSQPDVALRIFRQRRDLVGRQAVGGREVPEPPAIPARRAFLGGKPKRTVAGLENALDKVVHQAVRRGVAGEAPAIPARHAAAQGGEPHRAVLRFADAEHLLVRQAVLLRVGLPYALLERRGLEVHALKLGVVGDGEDGRIRRGTGCEEALVNLGFRVLSSGF